ncbi:putative integral membrane protein (TIGR02206 family) [Rhizomicrobium palustre]|uniref:Putative integral membrane protein (TIGR02206 family) n=1 Tax=Rhizomicrobium palustre TaxID=189966 RepID=A0A846MWX0_9PROT|nr:TIGR02206 family membrane protein [Rhizomicrobium palustre]NIK87520.1 putative integral membrane protein (TIGR02206 family) [Rhizomicrobium palustre]
MGIATAPFQVFGPSHKLVLFLIVALPVALALLVRFLPSARLARAIRYGFAAVIAGCWLCWYVMFTKMGWIDLGNALPLDLCSWAAIATIIALLAKSQKAYDLAWFWAMAGTVQGIVTPDIRYDFPNFQFIEFSFFHGGIIAAVLFLTLGQGMRVYSRAIPRVISWSFLYMAVAGLADWLLKVNYGFLRAKPGHASLYDLMPAWPWYIPVVVLLALVSIGICYLPFALLDGALWLKRRYQPISRPR